MKPETMMADGDECYVNHTSALECWLIMHSMRRVLNGGEGVINSITGVAEVYGDEDMNPLGQWAGVAGPIQLAGVTARGYC